MLSAGLAKQATLTAMPMAREREVVCRPIEERDFDGVIACLQRGFPRRRRRYWELALERLARRHRIDDYPRYGNILIYRGKIVGVLLQIFSRRETGAGPQVRCNLSSWCVDEDYSAYSIMLHLNAVKRREVTYTNISAAPHTRKAIEILGFRRLSAGPFVFAPILSAPRRKVRIVEFVADGAEAELLTETERKILAEHAEMGCRALVGLKDGRAYPFVFQSRGYIRRILPCPYLIYCRDPSDIAVFANAIGRYLIFRTGPLCVVDAKEPLPGLIGRLFSTRLQRYYKGPAPPDPGDLAYTELAILGE